MTKPDDTDLVPIRDRAVGQPMPMWTAEQVQLIKRTVCRGATDDELALFMATARRVGLDPFARQIYSIRRWNSESRQNEHVTMTGIDGFRVIAERTGAYLPGSKPTFRYSPNGDIVSATAYVRRYHHGEWHEVAAEAMYGEYVQTNKEGAPTKNWREKPHIMTAKCAEALALRKTFPLDLSGLYVPEEMGTDEGEAGPAPPAPPAPTTTAPPAKPKKEQFVPPPALPAAAPRATPTHRETKPLGSGAGAQWTTYDDWKSVPNPFNEAEQLDRDGNVVSSGPLEGEPVREVTTEQAKAEMALPPPEAPIEQTVRDAIRAAKTKAETLDAWALAAKWPLRDREALRPEVVVKKAELKAAGLWPEGPA